MLPGMMMMMPPMMGMMGMMGSGNFYRGIILGALLRELKSNNRHGPDVHIIKQQDHHHQHQLDVKCQSSPHYSHGYR